MHNICIIDTTDEFQIVESVSNSNVETVDKSDVDLFYASVPMKDLELVVGPVIQKARSRSNSPVFDASSPNPGWFGKTLYCKQTNIYVCLETFVYCN